MADKRAALEYPPDFEDKDLPRRVFSHSQYNTFKRCGRQYEFRYVDGVIMPPGIAMVRGTCVHHGAEYTLTKKMEGVDVSLAEGLTAVSDRFDELISDVEDPLEGTEKDEVVRMYEVFHQNGVPNINPLEIEKGFAVKAGGIPIIGFIDIKDGVKLLGEDGPVTPVIADIKTTTTSWSQSKVDTDTQLTLYSHIEGISNVRIDQILHRKSGAVDFKQLSSTRSSRDADVLLEDMGEVTDLIKKGVFPMADIGSWQCSEKWCGFWRMCRGKNK